MIEPSVDQLRAQLRERGYLSHGIERWFALDPWSSRAFWVELITVAAKAAVLIAAFAALPMMAVMLFRNSPVSPWETFALYLAYAATWLAIGFVFTVAIALILKLRPELAVDTPKALLAISLGAAALLMAPLGYWWWRFDAPASTPELAIGLALAGLFFVTATIVVSAALLSFSIYELHRIPAIHQRPRGVPMAIAAAALVALLFVPAYASRERQALTPMIVTTPTARRVALVAVDGLTSEILQSRAELGRAFVAIAPIRTVPGESAAERWASVGTGVTTAAHGVRAIAGVRIAGGRHILQRLSRADFVLQSVAPRIAVARREPLPPTVRRRDYIWELFARYGMRSSAANWWTSDDVSDGALRSFGQEVFFRGAKGDALRVDDAAIGHVAKTVREAPQFLTVYLPALDVVLNRLELDPSAKLAQSIRALDGVVNVTGILRGAGYDVVLIGLPGDGQSGHAVIASTVAFSATPSTAYDVAPTIANLLGFPLSAEMPGHPLTATDGEPRVASYGNRARGTAAPAVDEEYYENLKSLGYIR